MATISPSSCFTPPEGYRVWASTYDRDPNPLLSLEKRILQSLLPSLLGRDIVDLGCGTGRWLDALQNSGARSLFGVDPSPEMLQQAQAKLGDSATLFCGDYRSAPVSSASADIVLCSFVLSYLDKPEDLLAFARAILRPGGYLFLTDVHPGTATTLCWHRGVRVHDQFAEIRTHPWTIQHVTRLCQSAKLQVKLHLEPRFGDAERLIFAANGKLDYFSSIREYPAIYILQLSPLTTSANSAFGEEKTAIQKICGARAALGPSDSLNCDIRIRRRRIDAMLPDTPGYDAASLGANAIDLQGYLLLPGLVNAHDHLEFALFPRLGRGNYNNFLEWADDIHRAHADEIARHRQVPKHVRLCWGGIRNLLCGVTTVCHHNPYDPRVFSNAFPVRVLHNFGWAHSLALDPAAASKKQRTPVGRPFLIHLGEGLDQQSSLEIFDLQKAGALDEHTVIIHGLSLGARGGALLRAANGGLIWCPSSNLFLFGKSMSSDAIRQFPKVALGSDSSLTADGDLLDEMRCAHQLLRTPPSELYGYVTRQPARLLALRDGQGVFRLGGVADLIAVRDRGLTPADTLAGLSYRDIELVLLGGVVQLVSPELLQRLQVSARAGLQPIVVQGLVRWIRAPLDRLFRETQQHLGNQIFLGGKHVCLGD
ncbi:MAG TPA: methyltransferase domain-containing protein [Candidatus Eremiobacteraceae bacterium]|nr:methyltransferase domain-containing protein [Candidatus Eremiobacteraceae bacterium]